jgi:protein-S-isoprenylcysteine O-methyltransferase Ste14
VGPLASTHGVARAVFYPVLAAWLLLEWRVRLRTVLNRSGRSVDRNSRGIVYLAITSGIVGVFVLANDLPSAAIASLRWPLFILGIVLMVAGIAVRQWAVLLLGRFFTTDVRVHGDQTVVESGPYRWVRHPSYTGLLMTLLGIGLALGNWVGLLAVVLLPAVGIVVRIRVEERALLDGLGEPYRRFAATRAHLIPHVW